MKSKFFGNRFLAPGQPGEQGGGAGAATLQKPAEQAQRTTANNSLATNGKINSPKQDVMSAEIVDVSKLLEAKPSGKTYRMVTFARTNGTGNIVLPVNAGFFEANIEKFAKNKLVHVTIDNTIENETEYKDSEGNIQRHMSTGQAVSNIVEFSVREAADYEDEKALDSVAKYAGDPQRFEAMLRLKEARTRNAGGATAAQ